MGVNWKMIKDLGPQILATTLGTLIAVSDGMAYGWTSPMIPYFESNKSHIAITEADAEWFENINLIGAISGLPFTIFAVDYFGRKPSLLLSAVTGCICWLVLLLTTNVKVIYVARFFFGMAGDMCGVAAPMYVAEIADHNIRGFLASLIYLQMLIGILLVYCTGALAPYFVTSVVGIIITASQCVTFPFMPESPYYYVTRNRHKDARKALKRIRSDKESIDKEIEEIEEEIAREKLEKGRPQDLVLVPSNRLAMIIMLVLNGGQHFVGISVMMMNVQKILTEAGSVYMDSTTSAILFAVMMLASCSVASVFIDRFGRKILLILSGVLTGIALLAISIYFHLKYLNYNVLPISWLPAACVMIYAASFKVGLSLVPIVITAEIFPTNVKAMGMTLADVIYVVAASASINLYNLLYNSFGIHVPFYVFSAVSFLIAVYTYFWIPETKGKTLDEIQFLLKRKTHMTEKEKNIPIDVIT